MRLLLVADTYPPARISGALQMRDLALALAQEGHRPVVLTPTDTAGPIVRVEEVDGVQVLRVTALRTKDVSYWRRTLAEMLLPWLLLRGLRASPLRDERWDGLVWYSPTIFLGPLAKAIKRGHGCSGYLIVRDLFPDWAVDAGVMRKDGLAYRLFKAVERFQYRQANVIGVQTPANVPLVVRDAPVGARVEVLHNWLSAPAMVEPMPALSAIDFLTGRTIFVYAGNMGVAQDMDALVDLADRMQKSPDVGFVFVGRGSEQERLRQRSKAIENLLILDEVNPATLAQLLRRCHVGIVALHPAHSTHNIPGKLLTYLHASLPVLVRANANNDLIGLVEQEGVGLAVAGADPELLYTQASRLAEDDVLRSDMGKLGEQLARRLFSPRNAARQVIEALDSARAKSA
jgi:glycosyltransferase involved in cell wall biosynthesis